MVQRERQGDERAKGMTDDDGTLDAESCESLSEQIRLSVLSQSVLEFDCAFSG